jgi:hypothetical protein
MRKLAAWILAIGLVVSPAAMAADGPGNDKNPDGTVKTAPSDTSKADKKDATVPTSAELAAELDQLRALLKEQADQLEEQRQELAAMKASLTPATGSSAVANSTVAANSNAPAGFFRQQREQLPGSFGGRCQSTRGPSKSYGVNICFHCGSQRTRPRRTAGPCGTFASVL